MSYLENLKVTREPEVDEMELLNHCVTHGTSYTIVRTRWLDRQLKVFECPAGCGFFLGAKPLASGTLVIRDSQEHWATKEEAFKALCDHSWTQRMD